MSHRPSSRVLLCALLSLLLGGATIRARAQKAEATPAFAFQAELDLPVLAASMTLASAWFLHGELSGPHCAPLCRANKLSAFDRVAAGNWSPAWNRASDVALASMHLSSLALLVEQEGWERGLQDFAVVEEAAMAAAALQAITSMAFRRPRPYVYAENAPLSDRQSGHAALSFFSGHTANAFAVATASFMALRRLQPDSALPWLTLAVGLSTASLVGLGRVLSGNHFPTDVIAGAVIGSAIGIIVPALH